MRNYVCNGTTSLKRNKHPHPIIYMRGVRPENLKAMVDFFIKERQMFTKKILTRVKRDVSGSHKANAIRKMSIGKSNFQVSFPLGSFVSDKKYLKCTFTFFYIFCFAIGMFDGSPGCL